MKASEAKKVEALAGKLEDIFTNLEAAIKEGEDFIRKESDKETVTLECSRAINLYFCPLMEELAPVDGIQVTLDLLDERNLGRFLTAFPYPGSRHLVSTGKLKEIYEILKDLPFSFRKRGIAGGCSDFTYAPRVLMFV